jgi:hypothetical protein
MDNMTRSSNIDHPYEGTGGPCLHPTGDAIHTHPDWCGLPKSEHKGIVMPFPSDEDIEAAAKVLGHRPPRPDDDDPAVLTCDLCGKTENADDLTPDWNGDTGNHESCEQAEWNKANGYKP